MGKRVFCIKFKSIEPFREKLLGEWRCLSYDHIADKLSFEGVYVTPNTLRQWYKLNGGKKDAPKNFKKKKTTYVCPYISDAIPYGKGLMAQQFRGKPLRNNF